MALKDDIAKVEGKIDKMDDRLDKIDTHLAVYNEQLKELSIQVSLASK